MNANTIRLTKTQAAMLARVNASGIEYAPQCHHYKAGVLVSGWIRTAESLDKLGLVRLAAYSYPHEAFILPMHNKGSQVDCSPVHPDDLDSPEASAARKGGE